MKSKVCIITCYKQPDYIRAVTLRSASQVLLKDKPIIIKNSRQGMLRYIEVLCKLVYVRFKHNPDTYILTFRGYEILTFVLLITFGKKLIYDEFINPIEWAVYEHKKIKQGSILEKLLYIYYKFLLKRVNVILADTQPHADYSAKLMGIPTQKFVSVPVGSDDSVFYPRTPKRKDNKVLNIFYYGNMLPLHGLSHVCEAAVILAAKYDNQIEFTIVGGDINAQEVVDKSIHSGASIRYIPRLKFDELAEQAANSDVCLGGPFGDTLQASMVITGKTYQFLAAQKPVIIGKSLNDQEFKSKVNCILVDQGSAEALAQAIEWCNDNRPKLEKIAAEGRSLYETSYSVKAIAKSLRPAFYE